jgi:hypothetical protein
MAAHRTVTCTINHQGNKRKLKYIKVISKCKIIYNNKINVKKILAPSSPQLKFSIMFLKHLKIFSVMLNIFKNVEIFLKH